MTPDDSFKHRPRIAHITNHGYGGVVVPTGGAPDTGGQNVYVNAVVEAMVELGYHVTVFARGGFPFFESERLREGVEPFGPHARYVYVPGGGTQFLRKEDIAIALDEEVDWLEQAIDDEARTLGCRPWEAYEIVNTHYWDAGTIGTLLERRWCALRARELVAQLLEGTLTDEQATKLVHLDSRSAIGQAPTQFIGQLLYHSMDGLDSPAERTLEAIRVWCAAHAPSSDPSAATQAADAFRVRAKRLSPAVTELAAAQVIGETVVRLAAVDPRRQLDDCRRHVWTPHSLAVLKEENYRGKPEEIVRALKLNERRDHEAALCATTRAFAATSTEIAERLWTYLGIDTDRMFFFPPCVDRTKFKRYQGAAVDETYAYLSQASGVPAEVLRRSKLIFETSRMDRTKRKDLLLQAFSRVASQLDDVYLFIGGGPENAVFVELESLRAGDPLLASRAFLLGFIPEESMYPLFGMADLFVSASEMEGFGMSVAQAAAVGTALVASHLIPFTTQYVPEDAMIVRAGDVEGFSDAMLALLRDDEDRERRGERLAERTASLDWVVQSQAFLDHLRAIGFEIARPERVAT